MTHGDRGGSEAGGEEGSTPVGVLGGCTTLGSCRSGGLCSPAWTSHGMTEQPDPAVPQGIQPCLSWHPSSVPVPGSQQTQKKGASLAL